MKRKIGLVPALALASATLILGVAGTWVLQMRSQLQVLQSLSLSHELETTGLCANGLTLNRIDDRERLGRLLEQRLDTAVRDASMLTDQGVRLAMSSPNLRDAVRRAAAYYASSGNPEGQRRAEVLLTMLKRENE